MSEEIKNEVIDVEPEEVETNIDEKTASIPMALLTTGEIYNIDPTQINWSIIIEHMQDFTNDITVFTRTIRDLRLKKVSGKDIIAKHGDYIKSLLGQGIDYSGMEEAVPLYDIAISMLEDNIAILNGVIKQALLIKSNIMINGISVHDLFDAYETVRKLKDDVEKVETYSENDVVPTEPKE